MSNEYPRDFVAPRSAQPRSWEEGAPFSDALYEWMERAPWLAISAVAHAMVFLLLAVVPWHLFEQREEVVIQQSLQEVFEPILDDPIEPPPRVDEVVLDDDPRLVDADEPVDPTTADDEPFDSTLGDPDPISNDPFEALNENGIIGIGPGAGGKFGKRFGGDKLRGGPGGRGIPKALDAGLVWLVTHQHPDGHWDSDGFEANCPAGDGCSGPGQPEHDVGTTGLALLALLGDGHTTRRGLYRENVTRGVRWLIDQQDQDNGLLGAPIGHSFMYDHAIGALALCEAYYFSRNPILGQRAQQAVAFITTARNPYGVWRYAASPDGTNDSSVTGWMILALKSAETAGLVIDSAAFPDAVSWFDEVTDRTTGRVGYTTMGSMSSRIPGVNDRFPPERGEAMTAVGLFSRFFLGQNPEHDGIMVRHADLLLKCLPEWDPDGLSNDAYYWYYGSYAMYQMGGRHWTTWRKAMEKAVLASQRKDGHAKGSWDPIGPWGFAGGRVYSTALLVLCLEVYFRYPKLIGGR